eukprot:2394459-Pyramimonas_sp.AAC.2
MSVPSVHHPRLQSCSTPEVLTEKHPHVADTRHPHVVDTCTMSITARGGGRSVCLVEEGVLSR